MSVSLVSCRIIWLVSAMLFGTAAVCPGDESRTEGIALDWQPLPDLPDELGVAGPFAGVHNDALIVAGGANFPLPVWETDKIWHDRIHVLVRSGEQLQWIDGGTLPRPIAYGATMSTSDGIVCIGGNDAENIFDDVFVLRWNAETRKVERHEYPKLPRPCVYAQAALIGDVIYLAGGQTGSGLDSAMDNLWSLDLSARDDPQRFQWREHPACPGGRRAFNLTVAQHNGQEDCLYVISGRRDGAEGIEFLDDVWEFAPTTQTWRKRRSAPRCVMAGTATGSGKRQVLVLGGADGTLFDRSDALRDAHPGFPRQALAYDTISDMWSSAGTMPQNQVTTAAVRWNDQIMLPSGEVRPRVRTPKVWSITARPKR
ncbi:N-acetylneuraminate epimerase precursor [Rosistilla carotiformis]|uniref:N-acetylneuraminate epimerase n=1 Tax=Rosistilla carotiformis TaxID=2528017 RepID=A0A518JTB5_9BACT|nr:hypothetical protein [Rosistilla carotiformis]QDV68775.1 N-acetylneuraminate epimerase precursor [Rosistilla carotiformis]